MNAKWFYFTFLFTGYIYLDLTLHWLGDFKGWVPPEIELRTSFLEYAFINSDIKINIFIVKKKFRNGIRKVNYLPFQKWTDPFSERKVFICNMIHFKSSNKPALLLMKYHISLPKRLVPMLIWNESCCKWKHLFPKMDQSILGVPSLGRGGGLSKGS